MALLGKIFYSASQKAATGSPSPALWPLYSTGLCQELMFPMSHKEMNLLAKSMDSGARWPWLKSTSCRLWTVWTWTKHGTLLCLISSSVKWDENLHPSPKRAARIPCANMHKAHGEHRVCQLHHASTWMLGSHPQRFWLNWSEVCPGIRACQGLPRWLQRAAKMQNLGYKCLLDKWWPSQWLVNNRNLLSHNSGG